MNLINKTYDYVKEMSITLGVLKNSYLIAHFENTMKMIITHQLTRSIIDHMSFICS